MSTVSVVLAVYNGEKYLKEQMESVRTQTKQPDQVILTDDCSTDRTVSIIRSYISEHNLHHWKLVQNKKNLGWKKNFRQGFGLVNGDYIFPCDQDDIWHEDKIEKMVQCMERNPGYELITSNYTIFYTGENTGGTYDRYKRQMNNSENFRPVKMDFNWYYIRRPGCVYCIRKDFLEEIKEYWNTDWAHDAVFWRFACVRGTLGIFEYSTIDFRRHGDNVTSLKQNSKLKRIESLNFFIGQQEFFREYLMNRKGSDYEVSLKILDECAAFLRTRKQLLTKCNFILTVRLFLRYRDFYLNKREFLADIYFAYFNRI